MSRIVEGDISLFYFHFVYCIVKTAASAARAARAARILLCANITTSILYQNVEDRGNLYFPTNTLPCETVESGLGSLQIDLDFRSFVENGTISI